MGDRRPVDDLASRLGADSCLGLLLRWCAFHHRIPGLRWYCMIMLGPGCIAVRYRIALALSYSLNCIVIYQES